MLVSAPGVLLGSCSDAPTAQVVMPEGRCAASMPDTHFGVACDVRSDCPVSVSSGMRTEVRCVQFPGAGICVYGGGDVPDSTCADVTNVSTCGLGNYSTFVVADCDSDLTINVQDGTMCGVAMSPSDAGIDGGAYADADALDADDALDAVARNDSSVRPPPPTGVSFGGGGGCTCAAGGRKPGPGSALLALGLLGAVWARRRRFTAS
jgi:MYXO-CTERM domain-containing protein